MKIIKHKLDSSNDDICKFGYYRKEYKVFKGLRFGNDGSCESLQLQSIKRKFKLRIQDEHALIMIDNKRYLIRDIIATLFIPNPNCYRYLDYTDNTAAAQSLKWIPNPKSPKHKPVSI